MGLSFSVFGPTSHRLLSERVSTPYSVVVPILYNLRTSTTSYARLQDYSVNQTISGFAHHCCVLLYILVSIGVPGLFPVDKQSLVDGLEGLVPGRPSWFAKHQLSCQTPFLRHVPVLSSPFLQDGIIMLQVAS